MAEDVDKGEVEETETETEAERKERLVRQMAMVVCICKGIPLGRVLKGMQDCRTVAEVNARVGTGSGGCKGERCGPRIKALLKKKERA